MRDLRRQVNAQFYERLLHRQIKAGRKVKARRADKKDLNAIAEKCFNNETFKALKVKPTDIPEMVELMKVYAKEVDSIDFSEI